MSKVTRVRERTASPAELEEDRRRWQDAKVRQFATIEEFEAFAEAEQPTHETVTDVDATNGKNGRPELPAVRS